MNYMIRQFFFHIDRNIFEYAFHSNDDDNFYFTFEIKENLLVQSIYEGESSQALEKLFGSDEYINYTTQNIRQINNNELMTQQLIILDGLLNISSGFAKVLLVVKAVISCFQISWAFSSSPVSTHTSVPSDFNLASKESDSTLGALPAIFSKAKECSNSSNF